MQEDKSKKLIKEKSLVLESFLIKYFKLKPNRYTQNDYLFTRQGQDFDIGYNPRCQLLDITPVSDRFGQKILPYHAKRIVGSVKKLWEELSFDFLLEHGRNIDDFLVARIYGFQADSYPYIIHLTKNEDEWEEVSHWPEVAPKYQKRKIFQYAYFGSAGEQKLKIPSKIKKQQEKEYYSLNRDRLSKVMPEHITNIFYNQDDL